MPSTAIRRTRLSQLVLTGVPGTHLTAAVRRRLERLRPGGIVLFARNVASPAQVAALTAALRKLLGPTTVIAIDQEGGRVARLKPPFANLPPMRHVGAIGSAALARAAGRAVGDELLAAGINLNFAPVLDVDSNPRNPVIGDRAFSARPATVARLALAYAAGLADAGVLACGKHFPGHGDTARDSHLALPMVERSKAEIARTELPPFRRAIAARIPLLMTAHVLYPALDRSLPATLSPALLQDLLRKQLRYRGVVVSDDLAMHALDRFGPVGTRAVMALSAGCDLLLACQSLEEGEEACEALEIARERREISPALLRTRLARAAALQRTIARGHRPRASLDEVLGRPEVIALVSEIERRYLAWRRRRPALTAAIRGAASTSPRTSRARLRP